MRCFTCRPAASSCAPPMSAAGLASRTSSIPNGCSCCGRRGGWAALSSGSRSAAKSLSARRKDATTTRAAAWRSTRPAGFSRSMSTRWLISAPISRPTVRAARPIRRPARWAGVYAIPAVFMAVRGAFTNTVPIDAYRGAGKPEANFLIERLVDRAARRLALDPLALRRRNLISEFPHKSGLGVTIDCGRFAANLDEMAGRVLSEGFAGRRQEAADRGKLRGLGIACFLETSRGTPGERAEIRFEEDGRVALVLGTQSNGQGHETSFPQVAADLLGLPIAAFRFVQADTRVVKSGNGHGGARSMHMGGTALHQAAQMVITKGRAIAAHLLQADASAVSFSEGRFTAGAGARGIHLLALAETARDPANLPDGTTPGLDAAAYNDSDIFTFPNGCHAAEIEIDPETGVVTLENYAAIDDYGRLINPMLTVGQVQGGLAQGIGQAMLEHTVYDEQTGQLLSGSLMDYTLPRADDLPPLDITLAELPTAVNPLGVKGAGQAGCLAAPQTIVNAILDALSPLGIEHIDMPATPERVWRAIRSARQD